SASPKPRRNERQNVVRSPVIAPTVPRQFCGTRTARPTVAQAVTPPEPTNPAGPRLLTLYISPHRNHRLCFHWRTPASTTCRVASSRLPCVDERHVAPTFGLIR